MITSTANAKIKRIIQMQKKRKARDEEGLFQVEGIRMFREIPPRDLQEIYVSQSFWEKEESLVRERPQSSPCFHVSMSPHPDGFSLTVRMSRKSLRPHCTRPSALSSRMYSCLMLQSGRISDTARAMRQMRSCGRR